MAGADEAARYRKAAHTTLDQLDWCAVYLRRMHKDALARQLAANTANLRRRIDEPGGEQAVTGERAG